MANTKVEVPGSKEACTVVIEGLEEIKRSLTKCKSIEVLHTIIVSYKSIDFARPEVQNYINKDEHEKKRIALINLLADIEHLTNGIQLLYGAQKLDLVSLASGQILLKKGLHPIKNPAPVTNDVKPHNGAKDPVTKPVEAGAPINVPPAKPQPTTVSQAKGNNVVTKASPPAVPPKPGALTPVKVDPANKTAETPSNPTEKSPTTIATPAAKPAGQSSPVPLAEAIPSKEKIEAIKTLREAQLTEFTKYLKKLQAKRDQFHKEYPTAAKDDTSTAYGIIYQLVKNLETVAENYKNNLTSLDLFKKTSSELIKSDRNGVLSQHRGYKEIIFNLLVHIATIGLTYAYGKFFNQNQHLIKVNTDSVNTLDETLEVIKDVGKGPEIKAHVVGL